MLPVPSVTRRAVAALREYGCDTRPVRRRRAARPAGPRAAPGGGAADRRDHPRARGGLGRAARAPAACCAGSATPWTWSPTWGSTSGCGWPGPCPPTRRPAWSGWRPASTSRPSTRARAAPRSGDRLGLDGRPVVVCVSRLVPRKGQDTLLRAWPAVLAAAPDAGCCWSAAGRSGRICARLAERLRVAGSVHFTGAVPGRELPAYYDAGDVFAMPCRTRSGGLDVEGPGHRLPGGVRHRAAGDRRRLRRRARRHPRRRVRATWSPAAA